MKSLSLAPNLEYRKVIATIIVAITFLYFWLNGPLLRTIEFINLEALETKFSTPLMIGEDGVHNKSSLQTHNTIQFNEEKGFGYGLLLDTKTSPKVWGILNDVRSTPSLSEEQKFKIKKHIKQLTGNKFDVDIHASENMYFGVLDNQNSRVIYIESEGVVQNIRGYAGKINVGVFINEDGSVHRVEHISSKETESYLSDIKSSGFYKQFEKIALNKGIQKIDAVTGATISSEAIANTVSEVIKKGIPAPLVNYSTINEINTFNVSAEINIIWILHISVIFLMFLFALQKWKKKTKKSILILSLLSVLYLGFFLNNSFTYISFIHPFVGTSVSSLIGLYSLFTLLGAIWGKNTYCKYVCPFGNIQRLITHINPVKTSRKFFLSHKWIKRVRTALTIILLTGVLLGMRNWSNYELFPDLFGMSILSVWFVVSVLTVLATVIYPMIWCRLLCPTGSILDTISLIVKKK